MAASICNSPSLLGLQDRFSIISPPHVRFSAQKQLLGNPLPAPIRQWTSEKQHSSTLIQAAWTRRSSGQPAPRKNKKSWGQRVDKYMRPFILDILISRRYVIAKVMHRVTGKVVSVASTNSKDLRNSLPSLIDKNACKTIGEVLAERSKDADVFAVIYEPRKHEKVEGKLAIILDTITANDIAII